MDDKDAQPGGTYQALDSVVARLLGPGGCPWDREQTHQSLKRYLLEECYEFMEAVDAGDAKGMVEELGDVLAQVAFHIRLAEEAGTFTAADVFGAVVDKLERRHPHVFGDGQADTPEQVKAKWEEIKRQERGESASRLGQVPEYLPALAQAQLIQDRAAIAAFDWDHADDVLEKVEEEVRELGDASNDDEREAEMGDVLFSLVNSGPVAWHKNGGLPSRRQPPIQAALRAHGAALRGARRGLRRPHDGGEGVPLAGSQEERGLAPHHTKKGWKLPCSSM